MYKPVHLQGFPQVAWGVGRHPATDGGDCRKLRPAVFVRCGGRQALCQFGVALGEDDGRLAGDFHRLELLGPVRGPGVVQIIQGGAALNDFAFEVQHAPLVDGSVEGGVAGRALLHELGEQAGFVGQFPLRGDVAENAVAHAAALPVGDDLLRVGPDLRLGDVVAGHGSGVQNPQILDTVARQLGEGRHGLGLRAALAHDQLVCADDNRLVFTQVFEIQRPQHGDGMFPGVFLVERRRQERAFDGN